MLFADESILGDASEADCRLLGCQDSIGSKKSHIWRPGVEVHADRMQSSQVQKFRNNTWIL